MRILFILLGVFFFFHATDVASQVLNYDSIDHQLKAVKNDTAKINLLIKSGQQILYTYPEKALSYSTEAIYLSKKESYPLGLANAYYLQGVYFDFKSEFPKAVPNFQKADSIYHLYNGVQYMEGLGAIQHAYGTMQLRKGNYAEAVQFFIKASQILDRLHNKTILPKTYNNLAYLHLLLKQFDKANFYAKECLKLVETTNDPYFTSVINATMAAILLEQKRYKEALPHILKTVNIAKATNNQYVLGKGYMYLGLYYYFDKKDYPKAIHNEEMALKPARIIGNKWEEATILTYLAGFYFDNNQFDKARMAANKAYHLSDSLKLNSEMQLALYHMAKSENMDGNLKLAFHHLLQSYMLKDTVLKNENLQQINFLETIYESEKKENEILKLQKDKEITVLSINKKNLTIYALFVTLILLFGITFSTYGYMQHKRMLSKKENELHKHKIQQLESERILIATQSVLNGEEIERKRMSRDLHDGLGGLLSGARTSLMAVKNKHDVNIDITQTMGFLDSSINELRRVARNMMPEALMKLGLKDSLNDFCNELTETQPMHVSFQFYGTFERVDANLEINAYRIVQELVNNAIKHAEAKELIVQMIQEPNRLCYIVLDNGKGFDLQSIGDKKGIGLANIKSRVDLFKGHLEINSTIDKGTEISIEFIL